jgi:polyisoprenoid-binding protein YceI
MSLLESAGPILATGEWQVDPAHSAVEFRVRHMKIATVKGRFRDFAGQIVAGEAPTFAGTIRVASLDTHEPRRDEHLRSSDFFDAAKHPGIDFRSTSVDLADDGRLLVQGELEIKGVTRPIELAGEFRGTGVHPDGSERLGLTLNGALDRTDFGLTWNRALEAGGVLVGNTVGLELDISAVKVA